MSEILQGTQEWLDARKGRITASLAAAALGLDPHTSRQKAFRSIMGTEPQRDNRHMAWGREFEETARQDYESISGNLCQPGGFHVHPSLDWLAASPDGLIGEHGLLEVKCPSDCPARVPIHHRIQMLVQLEVTGRRWCDYFSWAKGGHFLCRVYPAGTAGLLVRLERFYRDYILANKEPERKSRRKRVA